MARPSPVALWDRYFADRSVENRNKLVEWYLPLVGHSIVPFLGRHQKDELLSHGFLALVTAIERVGALPGRTPAPCNYLAMRVRGGIIDELRRANPGSRHAMVRYRQWCDAARTLRAERGHEPTDAEIEDYLGLEPREWARQVAWGRRIIRPFKERTFEDGQEFDDGFIANQPEVGSELENDEAFEALVSTPGLTQNEREALRKHYGSGVSQTTIARELRTTPGTICQTLFQARSRIRVHLAATR